MDLSTIVDTPDAEFEILHPVTRVPTGNFFKLLGPQHPIRKAGFVSMKLAGMGSAAAKGMTDEEIIAERELQFLVDCTTGWRYQNPDPKKQDDAGPYIRWEGGNLVHTPDAVRNIYGKLSVNSKTEAVYEARQLGLL